MPPGASTLCVFGVRGVRANVRDTADGTDVTFTVVGDGSELRKRAHEALSGELAVKPETVAIMTVPTRANPDYAKGWSVNRVGNWWQSGGFAGTSSIAMRTHSDFCWAALANSYRPNSPINADLDALIWRMVGKVSGWTV